MIDVIAIDGPAGSGKSTTARLVAKKLGFTYLDTGALYRAVTHAALLNHMDLTNADALDTIIKKIQFKLKADGDTTRVWIDDNEITDAIRTQEVTNSVSTVSKHPSVRKAMVQLQRSMAEVGHYVIEGRDIGTVVFPDAPLKIFLIASIEARTERRMIELKNKGEEISFDVLKKDIIARDKKDSERTASPLKQAEDAIPLDTTTLTIDEQVDKIVALYHDK